MGKFHVASYLKNPRAEVVGYADVNPAALARCAETVPAARGFTDYREMLRETRPDLVSVALPNALHAPVTIDCMEAGADVLCEKPMSVNLEGALLMESEARRMGKTIYMNLTQRFGAFNRAAKAITDSGELGEIYHGFTSWTRRNGIPGFGGWFGQKQLSGGGPLIDLGVHRLDIAMWLMGMPKPVTVSGCTHFRRGVPRASAEGKPFDVEDFATGFIRFDNGASLLFEISWEGFQRDRERQCLRLIGTKAGLEAEPGPQGWALTLSHDLAGQQLASEMLPPKGPEPFPCEVLVNCILDGTPFAATARDGIRMQIILDALYASAASGREIYIADFAPAALELL